MRMSAHSADVSISTPHIRKSQSNSKALTCDVFSSIVKSSIRASAAPATLEESSLYQAGSP